MRYTIRLVILAAMLAFTLPAFAQEHPAGGNAVECSDETKAALYAEFLANRKGKTPENPNGNQDAAYNAAKKYMTACPAEDSAQVKFMKKWQASYEVGSRKVDFLTAYDKKNAQEALRLGKLVLIDEPTYVRAYLLMGNLGNLVFPTVVPESLDYAKKAIERLEAGQTPDDWRPFAPKADDAATGKLEALAELNFALGFANWKDRPIEAIPYLLNAARLETPLKKSPGTYYYLATAYENGPYAKLEEEYNTKFKGQPESPESKLAQANIDQLIDCTVDAYARAVALSTATDPKVQEKKKEWLERLTELYKYRHKSEAGLTELIAGVLATPLPDVPTPLTALPAPPAS